MTPNGLPTVSVVLPVYNGALYVRAAIESILAQTFSDFELIIIDDGSTDTTAQVVTSIQDSRIIFLKQPNKGLAETLNRGISLARGRYIARHDHDDMSLPTRFEKQVAFLDAHPDYALLGTRSTIWVLDQPTTRGHAHPSDDALLRFELLFDCPFVHGSVMIRRDALREVGGYTTDKSRQPPEDYELWSRLIRHSKVSNLDEALLIYREVPSSITRTISFKEQLVKICAENLSFVSEKTALPSDIQNIAALYHRVPELVMGKPDFKRMANLIRSAAQKVGKQSDRATTISARAEEVISQLKWQPVLICYGRAPAWLRRPIGQLRPWLSQKIPLLGRLKRRLFS